MMWRYRNANTGQVADLEQRDACLDMLPNWSATPIDTAAAEAPALPPMADPITAAKAGVRPSESANKAVWVAYATSRGMAEADAKALRKDALIQEFGENSDNNEDEEEGNGDGQD
ncbi:hypothetical protein [Nonomuraea sp. NPDC049141]|uniref:hypothetical protein n=1 Tax=Nonomuraea sp. NPDC049141 TaxID=3155500 RepID=UPI00340F2D4F